jgi:DNA-binding NarL/FixJ family response regulator
MRILAPPPLSFQLAEVSALDKLPARPEDHAGQIGGWRQMDGLSGRQRQVLVLVGHGFSNKAIAHALGISEATVKQHLTAIMRRLGVTGRTEAALRIPPPPKA